MNDEPPMRNPESEDYYQWTTYKARMKAAIRRADSLQYQVKEAHQLLAALVRKAGGEVRLTPREWWHDRDADKLGVRVSWTSPTWNEREQYDLLLKLTDGTDIVYGPEKRRE